MTKLDHFMYLHPVVLDISSAGSSTGCCKLKGALLNTKLTWLLLFHPVSLIYFLHEGLNTCFSLNHVFKS